MKKKWFLFFIVLQICCSNCFAENGYRLWLRYEHIINKEIANNYKSLISHIYLPKEAIDPTIEVIQNELKLASNAMLETNISYVNETNAALLQFKIDSSLVSINQEGFQIQALKKKDNQTKILILAKTKIGLLYGCFELLKMMQLHIKPENFNKLSSPKLKIRILNHWDNINRSVERGYAGISIFNWHTLPDIIDQRYIDYARANASIGINGTVLTNVNANAQFLTEAYLLKVKALADLFRAYGIKVYLTARFSAPIEIGGLSTADPLDSSVRLWWKTKAAEIYQLIPDFGGFLVKANSEGQPGPQNYQRTHADGANMLADALAPYKGIVIWRAFVYSNELPVDRAKQAFDEFTLLDGKFNQNVLLQIKNGPIDFQPREPFHPLFGKLTKTPMIIEFQLTQEYLGQATHLVYEAPLFKEILEQKINATKTIADVLENTENKMSGMSGVANIGNDINWCGHPFAQANWYAFGRLAWDPHLSAKEIANEWIEQTWSTEKNIVDTLQDMMLSSYSNLVNYMTPLGLHHIMGNGHHYGPMPWGNTLSRADWNPVYYHRADNFGIGFNRSITGSNAISQYDSSVQTNWSDSSNCDEKYLLWFHHVSWNHTMKNGNNLWTELCLQYNQGVNGVEKMNNQWKHIVTAIDPERFDQVQQLLKLQLKEAKWWRDACLLYFQTFSKQAFPKNYPTASHDLQYYQSLNFPFAPGNGK